MNLDQIPTESFILALFIREDGERFLLGSGKYEFKEGQLHFNANTYDSDVVEVQGNDGVLLAGQVRRASSQEFKGYVGDSSVSKEKIEEYRRDFLSFFRIGFYFKVVYVFHNGEAIQRRKGFLVKGPEVKELFQLFPEYSVSLNFEDVNYYSYAEDDSGNEVYSRTLNIPASAGAASGGLIWDNAGVMWDSIGAEWEAGGSGGATVVDVQSIANVYPVVVINGPTVNPELTILTTQTSIQYNGTITESQTLVIDMFNRTALLNGTSVVGNVSGDWVNFAPGENKVTYLADNVDANACTIYWQEVVG